MAALLLLGLSVAATIAPQTSRADAGKIQAAAYVVPPGRTDLAVRVLRVDGDPLRGIVKFRLTTGSGTAAEAVAEPGHRLEVRFRGIPLGLSHLQIASIGLATANLKFMLEYPGRETRLTVYLRSDSEGPSGGGEGIPELSARSSLHFTQSLDYLRRGELEKSRQQFRKLSEADLGDPNLQYFAGVLDFRSGSTGMALLHFSQAVYLNPEGRDSRRALAGLLYSVGCYAEAYEEYSRLAVQLPEDWAVAWQAASAAFLSAQYPGARAAAATVVARSTDPAVTASASALLRAVDTARTTGIDDHHELSLGRREAGVYPAGDFDPPVPLRFWAPPDVDGAMPKMVQGSPCNVAAVLNLAGRRVLARLDQLGEVAAKDHIDQAAMDPAGRSTSLGSFIADYLPNVLPQADGNYAVEEFLGGVIPDPSPGLAVAQGRASLALVFQPAMQAEFSFRCEGLTLWKDRPAWSIYFTQRRERPSRLGAHSYSGRSYPAYIRGRALLDQASGEVLHMETDLEDPIPELRLDEEHLVVDYTPVKFQSADQPYYLPSEAVLYVNLRGRLYRVREDFKEYVRFAVSTHQEMKQPTGQE